MDVDVSRILPVTARLGDRSGDSEDSGTVADDTATLDAEASRTVVSQVWSGSPAPCRGSVRVKQKIGDTTPLLKYPVPERCCQFGISEPTIP